MKQTVSLLVPAKNVEKTLEKAILSAYESLKGMDNGIIIENDSIDNTFRVAENIVKKNAKIPLSLINSKPGKIKALLTGLEYVNKGEAVLFVDSDVEANKDSFKMISKP